MAFAEWDATNRRFAIRTGFTSGHDYVVYNNTQCRSAC